MPKNRRAKAIRRKELRGLIKFTKKELKKHEKEYGQLCKMRPGGGRSKGNGFENRVAKIIVAAFGLKNEDCYRTPSSGGHRYAKHKDPGDLVLSKRARSIFPFSVECKCYKEVDLFPLWENEKTWGKSWLLKSWIKQSVAACENKQDVHPLVVFKQNTGPILAVLPELMPLLSMFRRKMRFEYEGETWYVVLFTELLRKLRRKNK